MKKSASIIISLVIILSFVIVPFSFASSKTIELDSLEYGKKYTTTISKGEEITINNSRTVILHIKSDILVDCAVQVESVAGSNSFCLELYKENKYSYQDVLEDTEREFKICDYTSKNKATLTYYIEEIPPALNVNVDNNVKVKKDNITYYKLDNLDTSKDSGFMTFEVSTLDENVNGKIRVYDYELNPISLTTKFTSNSKFYFGYYNDIEPVYYVGISGFDGDATVKYTIKAVKQTGKYYRDEAKTLSKGKTKTDVISSANNISYHKATVKGKTLSYKITAKANSTLKAKIYNSKGKIIKTYTLTGSNINKTIKVKNLKKGTYYLQITSKSYLHSGYYTVKRLV